ncbi:class I SAM-dependent methyltransferase [Rugosimonospora africana]|uniref:Methyltransferase n=1 Tax=Rugosimonospora africana TaxID=556532 RepID=A0A8J3VTR6_9ACTN|nr:class I SAM-dependent methyltransferase [Rugosimonospora africana]GIH18460.1 methyltransferase [Rugosimonospora africana]
MIEPLKPALTRANALAWQQSWDRQQEGFMPDREHRFAAMIDTVDALTHDRDRPPRVLDLAGGTGSISQRLLRRRPDAEITVADLDPVLLRIARASLPDTVTIATVDLRDPAWVVGLAAGFDAVLTATAMHWLAADRLATVYREVRDLLAPGGVLINADHMTDDGLPTLSTALSTWDKRRRDAWYAAAAVRSWEQWWEHVASDPVLGPLKVRRDELFSIHHSQEWMPPVSWHLAALRDAGFTETGIVWRGGTDAAVAGLKL